MVVKSDKVGLQSDLISVSDEIISKQMSDNELSGIDNRF
mgnify:CR=1 FL=1